ncbi:hypothetical protein [Microbispora sp. ATCC PTA-5024]|uniref:hypothetical protein n=1 Tax=Microbispora sp. ATCC PTA-5024 TaxID=316330 RepID=UPI0003DC6842|nr:hypothetical protein [Microbispora sp. ATCC PTA-5024]ETK33467.1 hypothetical protein MPTA5024_24370 [Microbispora sp. ATCC PTA-5024]
MTVYGWMWRRLPGGPVVRAALAAVLVILAAGLLWYVAFPRLDAWVDGEAGAERLGPACAR